MPNQVNNHCPLPWYSVTVPFIASVGGFPTYNFLQPFDNTKEIILLNLSLVDNLLAQLEIPDPPPATLTRPTIIPPGTSLTLAIGPVGYRTSVGTTSSAFFARQEWQLFLWTPSGNVTIDFDVNITYVQSQGGGGMVAP